MLNSHTSRGGGAFGFWLRVKAPCVLTFVTWLLLGGACLLKAAAFAPQWEPVSAEELADVAPVVEAGVSTEAIFHRIEIDDTAYPKRRVYRRYSRFKIYDPERASELLTTRLMNWGDKSGGDYQMAARLHLPSGKMTEFGKESFLERTATIKTGERSWWWMEKSVELKEKYLALSGVERGAIIEYYLEERKKIDDDFWDEEFFTLQLNAVPLRQVSWLYRYDGEHRARSDLYQPRVFLMDAKLGQALGVKFEREKDKISISAEKVPSLATEPFTGPQTDYALTVAMATNALIRYSMSLASYNRFNADGNKKDYGASGAWLSVAHYFATQEKEHVKKTKRVQNQVADLTGSVKRDDQKAQVLHLFVSKLRREYGKFVETVQLKDVDKPASPDEVLSYREKKRVISDDDFFMLALSLYRAAGLEAKTIVVPDRLRMRFNQDRMLLRALPEKAIGMQIDGRWYFSFPHTQLPMPFDMLPWNHEGQASLVADEHNQEFIRVPAADPELTVIKNTGALRLTEAGAIEGECQAIYTGHFAMPLRTELRNEDGAAQEKRLIRDLETNFPPCEIKIVKIEGLEEVDTPLTVTYTLKIEGYASSTKDMLVMKSAVFRSGVRSPFSASTRRFPVVMPFRWQERDEFTVEIPQGFELAGAFAPPSDPGTIMNYVNTLAFSRSKNRLVVGRDFTSGVIEINPEVYRPFKAWYDAVASGDQHEVALKRKSAEAVTVSTAAEAGSGKP
jgi:hypothetical protein